MMETESINELGWKIKNLEHKTYKENDAREVLQLLLQFRSVSTVNHIYNSLLLTDSNCLEITIEDYEKHTDNSGHYKAKISHSEFPEGFDMEIEYDSEIVKYTTREWAYGG